MALDQSKSTSGTLPGSRTAAASQTETPPVTAPKRVSIFGSTGSIGTSTVDLLQRNRDAYHVDTLVAGRNVALLAEQARDLGAARAVVADGSQYEALKEALAGSGIEVAAGQEAVVETATRPVDWVMAAIVGAAGLEPTLAAIRQGITVALANKECIVCAGDLMMAEVSKSGAILLPVDSEHNAIFQVLDRERMETVEKIILTASGGPFRTRSREEMAAVTPAQAVAHPNWSMGAKISVDSASMMNKGLELIEAAYYFHVPETMIDVVVHPQSIIHSMVAYKDSSVLAQMGTPDMRTPIAYSLAWPDRMKTPCARLDLGAVGTLTFETPDTDRFPALRLAREALKAGGRAPIVLNAVNEIAVQAFLDGKIGFLDISRMVEDGLGAHPGGRIASLDDVRHADREARVWAQEQLPR